MVRFLCLVVVLPAMAAAPLHAQSQTSESDKARYQRAKRLKSNNVPSTHDNHNHGHGHGHFTPPARRVPQTIEGKRKGRKVRRLAQLRAATLRARRVAKKVERPVLLAEFRQHAQRMARLARMHELAVMVGNAKLVARIGLLKRKERARHSQWIVDAGKRQ